MAILLLAADVGFVDLDNAHQSLKVGVFHRSTDAMAHEPSSPIIAALNLAMDLKGADAFLGLAHQIDDLKPSPQRIIGILEYRLGDDAESIAIASTAVFILANPMEGLGLQRIDFGFSARAFHAIGPTHIAQQLLASVLSRIISHQVRETDRRLGR